MRKALDGTQVLAVLHLVSEAIHALQRERGYSTLVVGSDGRLCTESLDRQRTVCDDALDRLSNRLDSGEGSLDASWRDQVALVQGGLSLRHSLVEQRASGSHVIDSFSRMAIDPLIAIATRASVSVPGAQPGEISAYHSFLQWKEHMGRERAYGSLSLLDTPLDQDQTAVLRYLIHAQESHERSFLTLATTAMRQQLLDGSTDLSATIDYAHHLIDHAPEAGLRGRLTPEGWFDLLSRRIDEMFRIEIRLIDSIGARARREPELQADRPLPALQMREDVLSLPLLQNLDPGTLTLLLDSAHVLDVDGGQRIVQQGEYPEKLFVVLSGWLKTGCSNENGDDAVLQMHGPGDMVCESNVINDVRTNEWVEAERAATLLALPAITLRHCLRQDTNLLNNALVSLARKSQDNMHSIERIRLLSVRQRLGRFLLELYQGSPVAHEATTPLIKLPYSKSTIASLLGMTPETLSRVLKTLGEFGVSVKRDDVALKDIDQLKAFCDAERRLPLYRSPREATSRVL